jgi:hypothetical protein
MPLTEDRLQNLTRDKDYEAAFATGKAEGWAIIDGSLVIYDCDDPPDWLIPVLASRNDDGDTPAFAAAHAHATA